MPFFLHKFLFYVISEGKYTAARNIKRSSIITVVMEKLREFHETFHLYKNHN